MTRSTTIRLLTAIPAFALAAVAVVLVGGAFGPNPDAAFGALPPNRGEAAGHQTAHAASRRRRLRRPSPSPTSLPGAQSREEHVDELIIRNARIVDGTGRPAFMGDVAVNGGRITEVGSIGRAATRVIDAEERHDHDHQRPGVVLRGDHVGHRRQQECAGEVMRPTAKERINHVPAVELADRHHVQAGDQHSHPAGHVERVSHGNDEGASRGVGAEPTDQQLDH